jgi:hypothetical protein
MIVAIGAAFVAQGETPEALSQASLRSTPHR